MRAWRLVVAADAQCGQFTDVSFVHAQTRLNLTVRALRSDAAVSQYKPAFSRKNLEGALKSAGIDYVHFPELGVPSDIRGLATASGRRDDIWDWYDEHVLPQFSSNLHWFFNSTDHPVALMCVEKEAEDCHRHVLAGALERQGLISADL